MNSAWQSLPLTTHYCHLEAVTSSLPAFLVRQVIFDRKLYREVVWSFTFNRVLDTNFTFFKSKIHSNWHIFNLTTYHSRLFTVRYSVFSNPYSIFGIHHSPLTATGSPLISPLGLTEFSIHVTLNLFQGLSLSWWRYWSSDSYRDSLTKLTSQKSNFELLLLNRYTAIKTSF
jgi:hypothetical protein